MSHSITDSTVLLGHGSGGQMMKRIIDEVFLDAFGSPELLAGNDAGVASLPASGRIAMSTDSFVVTPQFFPGGNIGRLAVCGTVNDVATSGANVRYLSCGFILEEGYPVVEEMLKGYPGDTNILGRLDGSLPRDGELNPDLVAKALCFPTTEGAPVPEIVMPRPPALCNGCSHRDVYKALNEVIASYGEGRVFADIGCYTLGALPPFQAINSTVDMGASITMAKGACDAGLFPAVAVIGDSTFTHSGMTGLLDAVNEKTPITVIISDNESISMTGGQESSALGKIESICRGIGVEPEHIRVMMPVPKNHEELCRIIREEVEYKGVSVIIPRRICIQKAARDAKKNKK